MRRSGLCTQQRIQLIFKMLGGGAPDAADCSGPVVPRMPVASVLLVVNTARTAALIKSSLWEFPALPASMAGGGVGNAAGCSSLVRQKMPGFAPWVARTVRAAAARTMGSTWMTLASPVNMAGSSAANATGYFWGSSPGDVCPNGSTHQQAGSSDYALMS